MAFSTSITSKPKMGHWQGLPECIQGHGAPVEQERHARPPPEEGEGKGSPKACILIRTQAVWGLFTALDCLKAFEANDMSQWAVSS